MEKLHREQYFSLFVSNLALDETIFLFSIFDICFERQNIFQQVDFRHVTKCVQLQHTDNLSLLYGIKAREKYCKYNQFYSGILFK